MTFPRKSDGINIHLKTMEEPHFGGLGLRTLSGMLRDRKPSICEFLPISE
jgi:hypothetical protein